MQRLAALDEAIHSARVLAWNASQMGDAASFGRVDRILDGLYRERDGIVALHPEATRRPPRGCPPSGRPADRGPHGHPLMSHR